jgi:hypothetical protein
MKVGDIIRFAKKRIGGPSKLYGLTGIVVSIASVGVSSVVGVNIEVLVDGQVVSVGWGDVEVINESR